MSALVKIGLPSQQAEAQRFVRRVRMMLEQRDAAFARIEADFRARIKALLDEESGGEQGGAAEQPLAAAAG